MTYTKGSGTPGYIDVNVISLAASAIVLLGRYDNFAGLAQRGFDDAVQQVTTAATGKRIRFSSTTVADSLAPGIYNAAPISNVSGYGLKPCQSLCR